MFTMGMTGTKWNIFTTSVELFSEYGFHNVSMRSIAKHTGIQASSLYNHFKSKEDILLQAFDFFNAAKLRILPDLNRLLGEVEEQHPYDVLLDLLALQYPPDIERIMHQIHRIILVKMPRLEEARRTFESAVVGPAREYLRALMQKMMQLGKIEPLDIDAFIFFYNSIVYYTSMQYNPTYPINPENWKRVLFHLISVVKVSGEDAPEHFPELYEHHAAVQMVYQPVTGQLSNRT